MYSKLKAIATAAVALSWIGCAPVLPWHDEPVASEVNIAFTIHNNLLFLSTPTIENHRGRFFLSTASARSAIDPQFAATLQARPPFTFAISEKESLRVEPVVVSLGGTGDAMFGADVWGRHSITIDYHAGLVTYQKQRMEPAAMTLHRFSGAPAVLIDVDGKKVEAIVDTALPDTLVLPAAKPSRGTAHVQMGGTDFGTIDVQYASVAQPRAGNRLLSRFLVSIDYGQRVTGLWRDPRIPL